MKKPGTVRAFFCLVQRMQLVELLPVVAVVSVVLVVEPPSVVEAV
jgi:competence protein ComGC